MGNIERKRNIMAKKITFLIDEEHFERIKEKGNELGMTMGGFVRYLVLKSSELKVKGNKKKKPD
nr:plasmid transcriptional repressor protein [Mycoplasma capricolum]